MREPPADIAASDVLTAVRRHWDADVTQVEHLPVGFGAHHWAAYGDDGPRIFVTLDRLEPRRTLVRLEAAYAGAAALHAGGLEFVVAPLPTRTGPRTLPLGDGALSCTPWRHGRSGGRLDVAWTTAALDRLHSAAPPPGLPLWRRLVEPDLAENTARLTGRAWGPGPFAAPARDAVRAHLSDVGRWTERYHRLAQVARGHAWVATHGEPHSDNQL